MLGFVGVFEVYPRACSAHMQHMHLQGRESVRSHTHTPLQPYARTDTRPHMLLVYSEIVRAGEQGMVV